MVEHNALLNWALAFGQITHDLKIDTGGQKNMATLSVHIIPMPCCNVAKEFPDSSI